MTIRAKATRCVPSEEGRAEDDFRQLLVLCDLCHADCGGHEQILAATACCRLDADEHDTIVVLVEWLALKLAHWAEDALLLVSQLAGLERQVHHRLDGAIVARRGLGRDDSGLPKRDLEAPRPVARVFQQPGFPGALRVRDGQWAILEEAARQLHGPFQGGAQRGVVVWRRVYAPSSVSLRRLRGSYEGGATQRARTCRASQKELHRR